MQQYPMALALDVHIPTLFILCFSTVVTSAYPRATKEFRGVTDSEPPLIGGGAPGTDLSVEDEISNVKEPTCEELRTMWRFSKRQSRAAEMTNAIPTYKDPFVYNEWDTMPKLRLAVGRPVYFGKMLYAPQQVNFRNAERSRAFSEYFGTPSYYPQSSPKAPKNLFRLGVGGSKDRSPVAVQSTGSFQHLKDLIKKERAKELQDQRVREDARAKAANLRNVVGKYSYESSAPVQDNNPNSYFSLNNNRDDPDPHQKTPYGQVMKSAPQSSLVGSRSDSNYYNEW